MRHVRRLMVTSILIIAMGCGDDAGSGGGNALSARADGILGCLTDAGMRASSKDTTAFGVEAPHDHLTVTIHSDAFGDESQADVWIFESPADAEEARPLITFQDEDTETNRIVGSSLVHYNSVIPDPADAGSIESCL
jgi:hypothetical protein